MSVHGVRARGCGHARPRLQEGARLIQDRLKIASGRAAFGADLDPAGILHAVTVGAPQAGVRLVSANGAAARARPGVAEVLTALDEPGLLGAVAHYSGAPLAVVAAEDRELAERAGRALEVEVEPEGANFDVQTSPAVAWAEVHEGDPDLAFSTCDREVEGTWRWPLAAPPMLEPTATRAWIDEDGRLVLRATTAVPFALRARVAHDLALPAASVRVVRPTVGAPFGALSEPRAASLCAALALRTGRAVSLIEERDHGTTPPEAAHLVRVRAGFRDGQLAAVDALLVVNLGALCDEPGASFAPASFFLRSTGAAFRLDARAVLTGLPPVSDARLQATRALRFALEGARDEAARASGPDAVAARAAAEDAAVRGAMMRALGAGDPWPEATRNLVSARRGRGIAVAGPWSQAGATATAALTSNPDGSLVLRTGAGGVPPGAGEALIDAAARGVGASPDKVSMVGTDTDTAPAQEAGPVEPWLLARAVREAATRLRADLAVAGRKKTRATAEATVTLGAEDLPAALAVVLADVEVDGETGLGRVARLVLAPLEGAGGALDAWEEGQLVAALPLVFGTATLPTALDAPEIVRRVPKGTAAGGRPDLAVTGPLPDLLPAAVAAIAHAFRDASTVVVREVPVRPEHFLKDPETR